MIFRHPDRNERFHLLLSAAGEVFHFEHVVPSNTAGKHCTQEEVTPIITRFLSQTLGIDWAKYEMVDVQALTRESCTDYTFKWEKKTPALGGLKLRLWAKVIGDEVGGWDRHVQVPLPYAMMFVSQPDGMYQTTGWASFGLLGVVLIYGYVARVRGAALDEQAITPAYVQHIAERERLKMELDIARKAQLRMLPQQIPQLPGLDIAAFSEPAKEEFGEERLLKVIESAENGTAYELLGQIRNAHTVFVDREEQHDDLTCLVVRVSK